MRGQNVPSTWRFPATPSASGDRSRDQFQQHVPGQNRLLAALPREDYDRLLPDLEPFALPSGWILHSAGAREPHLYFLTEGIVSRFYVTTSGASAGFAVTGSEGIVGLASFLGGQSSPGQAVVLSAGFAFRLKAHLLNREFEHDGPLPQLLLRYTRALIAQTGQIAVCNRHHSLEQQFCRFILSCLDRLPSNELTMTQEVIAETLGVRREGVTEAAGRLQAAGIIHGRRGHIAVLDRTRLEARACECHAVIKRHYDSLLRPANAVDAPDPRGHDPAGRYALPLPQPA